LEANDSTLAVSTHAGHVIGTRDPIALVEDTRSAVLVGKRHRDNRLDDVSSAVGDPMENYCSGRFSPLKPYFKGVLSTDLLRMRGETLVDAATGKDKILMQVFVSEPRIESLLYHHKWQAIHSEDSWAKPLEDPDSLVDLSGSFRSPHIDGYEFDILGDASREVFSMEAVLRRVVVLGRSQTDVQSLDLSACFLHDEDVACLPELLASLPACTALILSRNPRIGANPELAAKTRNILQSLLQERTSLFIAVVGCRSLLDPGSRHLLFNVLHSHELSRFIWLPSTWLQAVKLCEDGTITWDKEPAWLQLFQGRSNAIQAALTAHFHFYGKPPRECVESGTRGVPLHTPPSTIMRGMRGP
jgi:hypothetical protein